MQKKEATSSQQTACRFNEEYLSKNPDLKITKFDIAVLYCLPPFIISLFLFVIIKILIN